jgi:ribonuclease HI
MGYRESTNNQVEAYALLQGLWIATNLQIQFVIVIGESSVIINQMVSKVLWIDYILVSILSWDNKETNKFKKISFH